MGRCRQSVPALLSSFPGESDKPGRFAYTVAVVRRVGGISVRRSDQKTSSNSVPSFSLLPSVQILFAPFCSPTNRAGSLTLRQSFGVSGVSVFGGQTKRPLQIPYLRFLCCLLFKFSLLPFVHRQTGPVRLHCGSRSACRGYQCSAVRPKDLSNSVPSFSLLPSVQILFAPFCSPSKTTSRR